jgi:hypothetical protein
MCEFVIRKDLHHSMEGFFEFDDEFLLERGLDRTGSSFANIVNDICGG